MGTTSVDNGTRRHRRCGQETSSGSRSGCPPPCRASVPPRPGRVARHPPALLLLEPPCATEHRVLAGVDPDADGARCTAEDFAPSAAWRPSSARPRSNKTLEAPDRNRRVSLSPTGPRWPRLSPCQHTSSPKNTGFTTPLHTIFAQSWPKRHHDFSHARIERGLTRSATKEKQT